MIRQVSSYSNSYVPNLIEDNFRNFIMNGDFRINQRSFTSSTTTGTYGYDRWFQTNSGGTVTVSSQVFSVGSPAQAGYESQNYLRVVTSGQSAAGDVAYMSQRIEDVRTLAGSDVTLSFWAKSSTGTPKVGVQFIQEMGTGGTPSANVSIVAGSVTIDTTFRRYVVRASIPNLSGKTLGTNLNSSLRLNLWVSSGTTNDASAGNIGIQSNTFDIWGVQLERGITPTNFEQASVADQLSFCQRYYYRMRPVVATGRFGAGHGLGTTTAHVLTHFPVTMRVAPSAIETTGTPANYQVTYGAASNTACSATPAIVTTATTVDNTITLFTVGSAVLAANLFVHGTSASANTAFLGWSAEI